MPTHTPNLYFIYIKDIHMHRNSNISQVTRHAILLGRSMTIISADQSMIVDNIIS